MQKHTINPVHSIELQEVIQKLRDNGFGKVIDCLLANERECYTKKGRLNKSSTCRKLECKGKELEAAMRRMRELLREDLGFEEE